MTHVTARKNNSKPQGKKRVYATEEKEGAKKIVQEVTGIATLRLKRKRTERIQVGKIISHPHKVLIYEEKKLVSQSVRAAGC